MSKSRKQLLQALNKQRNRLKDRGARPSEITDYMGIDLTVKFGDLPTGTLRKLYDRQNSFPRVVVTDQGTILPSQYIQRFRIWNGATSTRPMAGKFNTAINSNFLTKDKSLDDTRKRRNEFERKVLDDYVTQIQEYVRTERQQKLVNQISKLTPKQFSSFLRAGAGTADFDIIYYPSKFTDSTGDTAEIDEVEQYDSLFNALEKAYRISRKRRK